MHYKPLIRYKQEQWSNWTHVTFSTEHPTFAAVVLVRWITKSPRVSPTDRYKRSSQLLAQHYLTKFLNLLFPNALDGSSSHCLSTTFNSIIHLERYFTNHTSRTEIKWWFYNCHCLFFVIHKFLCHSVPFACFQNYFHLISHFLKSKTVAQNIIF